MVPICVISHNAPEIVSNFDIWIPAWDRSPLCAHSGRWWVSFLQDFVRPAWEHKFAVSLENVYFLWLERLKMELFADPPYPPSKDRQSNFLPRSRRIQWIYQEGLVFRTDALDLGFFDDVG